MIERGSRPLKTDDRQQLTFKGTNGQIGQHRNAKVLVVYHLESINDGTELNNFAFEKKKLTKTLFVCVHIIVHSVSEVRLVPRYIPLETTGTI